MIHDAWLRNIATHIRMHITQKILLLEQCVGLETGTETETSQPFIIPNRCRIAV